MLVHSLFEFLASFFPICHHQNLYDMKRGETNRKEREERERDNVSNGSEKHQKYFIYSSKGKIGGRERRTSSTFFCALSLYFSLAPNIINAKRPGKGKEKNVIGTMMFKKQQQTTYFACYYAFTRFSTIPIMYKHVERLFFPTLACRVVFLVFFSFILLRSRAKFFQRVSYAF